MDDLGAQEQAILDIIAKNPFAGQQEMADMLGLARSTVAAHIVQLTRKGYILGRGYVLPEAKRVMCVGGAVLDRKFHARKELVFETSNPVDGYRSFGGVARNVAENLARLGVATSFSSMVGDDEQGRALVGHLRDLGIDVSQIFTSGERPTAEYAAILSPDNNLVLGIADMDVFDQFAPGHIERIWPHLAAASWVFADCNLPEATLSALISRKRDSRFKLAIDAVSTPKALKLPRDLSGIDILFLNNDEANAMLDRPDPARYLEPEEAALRLRERGAGEVVVTMGASGVTVATAKGVTRVPPVAALPVDVTGAGDAMIAGTLYRVLAGEDLVAAARTGALAAALTTECEASVHPDLSDRLLATNMHRIPA